MCKIYSMSQEKVVHHIFCSGSIGVGKTTTLDYLKKRLVGMNSFYFVKEYIDYDPDGKQMLERSLDGSLSLVDFQLYICDQFYFQLEKFYSDIHTDCAFCIWERHPMEALEIFARDLSGDDKIKVRDAIIKMLEHFNIPDMNGNEITEIVSFNTVTFTPMQVSDWIYNTMLDLAASCSGHLWILLRCDLAGVEQYNRIRRRGRECEISEYCGNSKLMKLNTYYQILYKKLKFQAKDFLIHQFDDESYN